MKWTTPTWQGHLRRMMNITLWAVLLTVTTSWCLGIAFTAIEVRSHPDPQDLERVRSSTGTIYFYAAGIPMVSTIAAVTELLLLRTDKLLPVFSLTWSCIAVFLWAFIFPYWRTCEGVAEDQTDSCPTFAVYYDKWDAHGMYIVPNTRSSAGLWYTRQAFAGVALGMAVVQVGVAAAAVHQNRVVRDESFVRMKELGDGA